MGKIYKLLSHALMVLAVVGVAQLFSSQHVFAANFTWTGGGADRNFSTAGNWQGGVAPTGDGTETLIFDNTLDVFQDTSSGAYDNVVNDLTGATFLSIITQGAESDHIQIAGNDFSISSGITAAVSVTTLPKVTLTADQTFEGSLYISSIDVSAYNLTLTGTAPTLSGVVGTGNLIFSSSYGTLKNSANFNGNITVKSGAFTAVYADGFGNNVGSTTVESGASLGVADNGADLTITEPITAGGTGTASNGALIFAGSFAGGGAGVGTANTVNVSGKLTLAADTTVDVSDSSRTVKVNDLDAQGHTLTLDPDSEGTLIVNGEAQTAEGQTITITDNKDEQLQVKAADTVILNGSRGNAQVYGVLKGKGTAKGITVWQTGTLAPGLSPGCLNSDGALSFTSGTFQVEIAGAIVCSEYDQVKVTGTVNLGDSSLDLSLLNNYKPSKGEQFVIISNDGKDKVSGTFKGLAEGAKVKVGDVTFTITYKGGDGNDVVLVAPGTPDAPDAGIYSSNLPLWPFIAGSILFGLSAAVIRKRYFA